MPLYRYECEKCGHEFRLLQERNDDTVACPSCESTELHRMPSRVSIQFTGSGYYKTDRANKKSKAGTKGLSDKESSSEGNSSESGDSGETKGSKDSKESKSDSSSQSDKPSKSD